MATAKEATYLLHRLPRNPIRHQLLSRRKTRKPSLQVTAGARVGVALFEERIPLRPAVRGACEILGLDPLHIANEGQMIAVVAPETAEAAMRGVPGGEEAALIGEIREQPARSVLSVSDYGSTRIIDMLVGDPLPRIC